MLQTASYPLALNLSQSQKSQSVSQTAALPSIRFGEKKKNEQKVAEPKVRASLKERYDYANDNALLKDSCLDFLASMAAKLGNTSSKLKQVLEPILMVRFAILFAIGFFTAGKKIKDHFQQHPMETREVRQITTFLYERVKPAPASPVEKAEPKEKATTA